MVCVASMLNVAFEMSQQEQSSISKLTDCSRKFEHLFIHLILCALVNVTTLEYNSAFHSILSTYHFSR